MTLAISRDWREQSRSIEGDSPWTHERQLHMTLPQPRVSTAWAPIAEYELDRNPHILLFSAVPARWFLDAINRLVRFSGYQANWNGYGERVISNDAVVRSVEILFQVAKDDSLRAPSVVVPLASGGIQIEWGDDGGVLIEILPDGSAEGYVAEPDHTWPLRESADFVQFFRQLSTHA